jgi:uncharacterized protein with ParB-like and HNH nuclease domain
MAKTNVLDTDTANFSDIIGNGKIYRVPLYQRDYSWEEEHWDDLWQDIIELQKKSNAYHYMGAIVLQDGSNEKEFFIIDGQQRLVTLSILAIAVIAKIKQLQDSGIEVEENAERVLLLRNDYLGRKNPSSLFYSSKLFLNKNNNNFYQANLLQFKQPINYKALNDSDKLLWKAYNYFLEKLSALDFKTGHDFSRFLNDSIARQLLFIQINVVDEVNAYTVFETLNARGIELTSTDLLKNYLFSLVKSEYDLEHIQKQWVRISDTVSIKKLPEFLRIYTNSKEKLVRKEGLFKSIKNKFQDFDENNRGDEVLKLLDELEKYAYFYQALSQANHELWRIDNSCAKNIRNAIKIIDLFRVKQLYPLLFAAYEKLYTNNPESFYKILKICLIISFRYNIIGGKNPNELEKSYNEAAMNLNNGSIESPEQVFQSLKKVYIDDDVFINDFAYKTIKTSSGKKIVRYILFSLENENGYGYDFEDDDATIEHILPENPNSDWELDFSYKEQESYIYRLGNYTLLEPRINRDIKNKSYSEKQPFYFQSQYKLTQGIKSPLWNKDSLQKRQETIAKRAVQIWRCDY